LTGHGRELAATDSRAAETSRFGESSLVSAQRVCAFSGHHAGYRALFWISRSFLFTSPSRVFSSYWRRPAVIRVSLVFPLADKFCSWRWHEMTCANIHHSGILRKFTQKNEGNNFGSNGTRPISIHGLHRRGIRKETAPLIILKNARSCSTSWDPMQQTPR
jgi:hypothetical protein